MASAARRSSRAPARSPRRTASAREERPSGPGPDEPLSPEAVPGARRARLPASVLPQLATLVDRPPDGDEWLHELKYDGYRILARLDHGQVRLISRNQRDWTGSFAPVAAGVAKLPASAAIIDGEVAVFLPDGTTSFQALQNASAEGGQLAYIAFDLLHLDGWDVTGARLEDRKALLARLLKARGGPPEPLRYGDHVAGSGPAFYAQACRHGLEGIVSKRRSATYQEDARTPDWLKIKCTRQQEIVIGGYTEPAGSRVGLGALLAGVNEDGRLVFAGKVGTGFSDKTLRDLHRRLRAVEQPDCPFTPRPKGLGQPHWVKPTLVAQVVFGEWTADGRMRHPSFQGLREDKPASEVVRELPAGQRAAAPAPRSARAAREAGRERSTTEVKAAPPDPPPRAAAQPETNGTRTSGRVRTPARGEKSARAHAPAEAPSRGGRDGVVAHVAGVRLTHADRVLYPPQKTTKRDLALFYESIAEWILPHLAGRPTTLVRCPEGVGKPCFYQKHTGYWAPESVRRVKIREQKKIGEYLIVDTLPALIGLVQIGILEIHTWNSVVDRLERPDRVVFDLDPAPDVAWPRVIDAARMLRTRLQGVGLASWVKTTGGKGLHVVVPLSPATTWEEGAAFSRGVAEEIAREDGRHFVAHMAKAARVGKIFIDYLRNVRGATSVAAYSTRAKPEAPVSVPLDWDELSPRQISDHYTIANVPRRLAGLRTDPWAGYWTARQSLPAADGRARSPR